MCGAVCVVLWMGLYGAVEVFVQPSLLCSASVSCFPAALLLLLHHHPPPPHPQTLINGSFFLSLTHLFTVIYSLSLLSLFPCCASSHSLSGSHSRSLTPSLSLLLFLTPPVALVRTLRPNPEPPFSACFTQCPCPSPPTLSLVPTAWTLQN